MKVTKDYFYDYMKFPMVDLQSMSYREKKLFDLIETNKSNSFNRNIGVVIRMLQQQKSAEKCIGKKGAKKRSTLKKAQV